MPNYPTTYKMGQECSRNLGDCYSDLKGKVCPPLAEDTFSNLWKAYNSEINRAGRIDQQGFERIITQVNNGIDTDKLRAIVPAMYKVYDQNKDAVIDVEEFVTISAILADNMNQEAAIELLFDVIDNDNSGDISKRELSEIMKVIYHIDQTSSGGLCPEEMTENIFRQIDINDDGKITKKEFIEAFTGDGDRNTLRYQFLYRNLRRLFI